MKDIKNMVRKRVRSLRIRKGLSQEALAERAALHRNEVGMIERGEKNCSLTVLARIATGLRVKVNELVTFPQADADVTTLRRSVIKEINKASPEVVRLVSDLLDDLRVLRPKRGSKNTKKN